jgi:hypothetical protein
MTKEQFQRVSEILAEESVDWPPASDEDGQIARAKRFLDRLDAEGLRDEYP